MIHKNMEIDAIHYELRAGGKTVSLDNGWEIHARLEHGTSGAREMADAFVVTQEDLSKYVVVNYVIQDGNFAVIAPAADYIRVLKSESREYYDRIGPWATGKAVRAALGVTSSALGQQRKARRLLGVAFGKKGDYFYPVQQFLDGDVVDGLHEVLVALSEGFTSPESQAGWFAETAYKDSPDTRWDVLRAGHTALVTEWATTDARAVVS